jgi:L-iditol 2-dehydrogenase
MYPSGELSLDDVETGPLQQGWSEIRVHRFQLSVSEAFGLTRTPPEGSAAAGALAAGPARLFGHEFTGTVTATAGPSFGIEPGARVVSLGRLPCLDCDQCRRGDESRCQHGRLVGTHFPGCFAESLQVPSHGLVPVPESVDDFSAAGLQPLGSCLAAFGPFVERLRGGAVAVLGAGPMGLFLMSLAHIEGAAVFALARRPETAAAARRAGADVVAATPDELEQAVAGRAPGGVDVVFEAAGAFVGAEPYSAPLVELAAAIARAGGVVCSVGNVIGRIDFDPSRFKARSLSYVFPEFSERRHLEQAVVLATAGKVSVEASHVLEGLESLPAAIAATLAKGNDGVVGTVQVVV